MYNFCHLKNVRNNIPIFLLLNAKYTLNIREIKNNFTKSLNIYIYSSGFF